MVLHGAIKQEVTKVESNGNGNMTILDVLKITIDLLSRIKVPVGLLHDVAIPIESARNNLLECIKVMQEPKELTEKEVEQDGREADVCE